MIFPINNETADKIADVTIQIAPIPTQNGNGYIDIIKDFSLKNQLPFAKNNECSQLNIPLKSMIAHTAKTANIIKMIEPAQTKALPSGLLPHNNSNKTQNIKEPTTQIPNAILTFAKNAATSSR